MRQVARRGPGGQVWLCFEASAVGHARSVSWIKPSGWLVVATSGRASWLKPPAPTTTACSSRRPRRSPLPRSSAMPGPASTISSPTTWWGSRRTQLEAVIVGLDLGRYIRAVVRDGASVLVVPRVLDALVEEQREDERLEIRGIDRTSQAVGGRPEAAFEFLLTQRHLHLLGFEDPCEGRQFHTWSRHHEDTRPEGGSGPRRPTGLARCRAGGRAHGAERGPAGV
jgi:hypothetical protein